MPENILNGKVIINPSVQVSTNELLPVPLRQPTSSSRHLPPTSGCPASVFYGMSSLADIGRTRGFTISHQEQLLNPTLRSPKYMKGLQRYSDAVLGVRKAEVALMERKHVMYQLYAELLGEQQHQSQALRTIKAARHLSLATRAPRETEFMGAKRESGEGRDWQFPISHTRTAMESEPMTNNTMPASATHSTASLPSALGRLDCLERVLAARAAEYDGGRGYWCSGCEGMEESGTCCSDSEGELRGSWSEWEAV
jgi:hypothetical protein